MKKVIYFYKPDKPYGVFSNFYLSPFQMNGLTWKTTEHYFQAMKFEGTKHFYLINEVEKPMMAAHMGKERFRPLRSDWETVKDSIMYRALKAKFDSKEDLKKILLSTGDAQLIEHTSNDNYWADGGDGTGLNKLGVLLMKLRNSYAEYDGKFYLPQWLEYPGIHPLDIFWRMGAGEDHVVNIGKWISKLGQAAWKEYEKYYPYPDDWKD